MDHIFKRIMKGEGLILPLIYKLRHRRTPYSDIPYNYRRSLISQIWHSLRKFICQNIAPNCVFNATRIMLYRLCGFKIGGGDPFIGTRATIIATEDIEIGENAIVGAMTLVNRSIPPNSTAVGIPCRIIKNEDNGTK